MSVIKFRTWNGKTLEYDPCVYGSHELGECWINKSIEYEQQNGIVFEQFIGLKDKNDREIYAGDEIYFSMSTSQHYKGYVKWSDKELCYLVHCYWSKQDEILHLCNSFEMKYIYERSCVKRFNSECFDIEVIGNIHDNPELKDQQ